MQTASGLFLWRNMENQNAENDKLNDLIGSLFISLFTASLSVVKTVAESLDKEKGESCTQITTTTTATAPNALLPQL
jgi:hypothetical protein